MTSLSLSKITLPDGEHAPATVLKFLIQRFPHVSADAWKERVRDGKVLDDRREPINLHSLYEPRKAIYYSREVIEEPVIPFAEEILFQNDQLLVACKPHFLPVNPTGPFVSECLMNRLRRRTGNDDLVPINRIDRETAGLVLFSMNRTTRNAYYELFREGRVEKTYEAVAECAGVVEGKEWTVENRIVKGDPWFRMATASGAPNARSIVRLAEMDGNRGRFLLYPLTGKTHQLRLHMSGLGFGILNDRYYPNLQPKGEDDFDNPLQLLAKRIRFVDPLSGAEMEFSSERRLLFTPSSPRPSP